jgi:ribosomal protein L37E
MAAASAVSCGFTFEAELRMYSWIWTAIARRATP